jgi:hypothetical protein
MSSSSARSLRSADWLAFGVAVAALCLRPLYPAGAVVIALAVLAPSALRELGLLRDGDEWSAGIMHRAGFHGLLVVAALVTLNQLLSRIGLLDPGWGTIRPFDIDTIGKTVVWVFLVSSLIQYWGAREGVFRILLIVALVYLTQLLMFTRYDNPQWGITLLGTGIHTVVVVGLAMLVRHRPLAGGIMLLVLLGAVVISAGIFVWPEVHAPQRWQMFGGWLEVGLVFGLTGVALLREGRSGAD